MHPNLGACRVRRDGDETAACYQLSGDVLGLVAVTSGNAFSLSRMFFAPILEAMTGVLGRNGRCGTAESDTCFAGRLEAAYPASGRAAVSGPQLSERALL